MLRRLRSRRRSSCARCFCAQGKRACREGFIRPQIGALCATRRFGSRLDINVYHHAVLPNGVFTLEGEKDMVSVAKVAAPTHEELSHIIERVAAKTMAMVRHRGLLEEAHLDGLVSVQAGAIQKPLSLGAPPEDDSKKVVCRSALCVRTRAPSCHSRHGERQNLGPAQRAVGRIATPQA
jgi:hypothetical protein